ncbi:MULTISPECIES: nitroreductase family protein [unclassified Streptomyces]|uniref:nitroreductase family protein n=1 Tax=unclassified Streptomyces TaxID=2593676 RepID=UPI001F20B382|nr:MULTISPECIES: nitroreductase family protein [unclassified Streptomyces]
MPVFGDGVRAAGDIGMYAQNFLLSLVARGLDGIPQTMLGFYADVVREFLDVPEELKLLFGISFGRADEAAPVNTFRMGRVSLERSVVLHGTPGVLDER